MENFLNYINTLVGFDENEIAEIVQYIHESDISKDEIWSESNTECNQIAYVISGKLRLFYNKADGNEITCHFALPGMFISSFTSFITGMPANERIAAIENTKILVINKADLERLSDFIPKLHILRRIIAEHLYVMIEKRAIMLQSLNATERYKIYVSEFPNLLLSIPLHYSASYLGVTPQHLSRLRKKI